MVAAAHVNHRFLGEEGERDQRFGEEFAKGKALDYLSKK